MVARVKIKTTKNGKVAKRLGRPKQYDPKRFPKEAKFLAQRGATLAEIADCFGVTTRCLHLWNVKYPELQQAIDSGLTEAFNPRIERALAERALGYVVDEEQLFIINGEVVRETVRKHFPPDVTAGIYWTKNTMPHKWRDVHRHELNNVTLKSADELREAFAKEVQQLMDEGLLSLSAPDDAAAAEREMREIPPKAKVMRNKLRSE